MSLLFKLFFFRNLKKIMIFKSPKKITELAILASFAYQIKNILNEIKETHNNFIFLLKKILKKLYDTNTVRVLKI